MSDYIKFWGTRGSCSVSGDAYKRYGGCSACAEVRFEETHLILDAGTGIRPLGEKLVKEGVRKIDLFIGHTHWDHLIGFPFFDPIYCEGTEIIVWAPSGAGRSCRELFSDLLSFEFFPIRLDQIKARLEFKTIHQKTPVRIGPITVDFHTTFHPGPTYCFKIKTPNQTIGYVTDNEMLQGYHGDLNQIPPQLLEPHESLIAFLKGCDLLVHEAQYSPEEYFKKVGWGHSSLINASALIQRVKPGKWLITHHDPNHNDAFLDLFADQCRKLLLENQIDCPVEFLTDGTSIDLKQ